MLFNQKWTFLKAAPGTELPDIADQKNQFQAVDIPHDWLIYQTKDLYENSTGWYRKILDTKELARVFELFGDEDAIKVILFMLSLDGNELVRLVKKYELYIKPVKTYVLGDFYDSNE